MHARVSYVTADPGRLGDLVTHVEEVRPAVEDEVGCTGMMLEVDDEVGVAVIAEFWVSGDAMRQSEPDVGPRRQESLRHGAATLAVERYRVGSFRRLHQLAGGEGVRFARVESEPAEVEAAVTAHEDVVLPWLLEADGFCSAMLLVDSRSGRGISLTAWRDQDALAKSRASAAAVRADAVAATDTAVRALEEHRLVFSTVTPD